MSAQQKLTVLLTGGSGVLGESLIDCLAEDFDLVCLARKSRIRDPRVEVLTGDICSPRLGLAADVHAALLERVDWVIHAAAVTRLDGDIDQIFSVNYLGTENVVAFVKQAKVPLYHISTAFTHPCDYYEGVQAETPYEVAKRQAETLVRSAGIDVSIFRPSIIIGDAKTGFMPNFQGFHMTMGLMMSGVLPIVPCPSAGYVDLIARDVAAQGITNALRQRLIGEDYFLTSGPQSLDLDGLLDLMCQSMQAQAQPFTRPRCLAPDIYERLIRPVFLPALSGNIQAALTRATQLCRYACLRTPLPTSLPQLLGETAFSQRDVSRELLLSLNHLAPKLGALTRMLKQPVLPSTQASAA
ncbi:SDR family oxidoreductase [Pseudomonas sp. R3-18-08]|uniref:SDR family oxidoreductase n=1 Tax=Pseudomonas sp. R3-18-08 TaxID=1173283 RepID=UPI000F56B84A|nr:SDR family oxidoreductase [Pseudomonas sp. R3-18-08]AZF16090.1 Male sterility C-terminal domain [Pseudomonas sp. R3-18-08]